MEINKLTNKDFWRPSTSTPSSEPSSPQPVRNSAGHPPERSQPDGSAAWSPKREAYGSQRCFYVGSSKLATKRKFFCCKTWLEFEVGFRMSADEMSFHDAAVGCCSKYLVGLITGFICMCVCAYCTLELDRGSECVYIFKHTGNFDRKQLFCTILLYSSGPEGSRPSAFSLTCGKFTQKNWNPTFPNSASALPQR